MLHYICVVQNSTLIKLFICLHLHVSNRRYKVENDKTLLVDAIFSRRQSRFNLESTAASLAILIFLILDLRNITYTDLRYARMEHS